MDISDSKNVQKLRINPQGKLGAVIGKPQLYSESLQSLWIIKNFLVTSYMHHISGYRCPSVQASPLARII